LRAAKPGSRPLPEQLLEIARRNLSDDWARRFICKKYGIPHTDPRLDAMTDAEIAVEFLEDEIESGRIALGANGQLIKRVEMEGGDVVMYVTGDIEIDALERAAAAEEVRFVRAAREAGIDPFDEEAGDDGEENLLHGR